MRELLLLILIVLQSVASSCSKSDNASLNNPETKIEYWNLLSNSISYNGDIDELNKRIVVRGVPDIADITGASYKLSSQAAISPDPATVTWEKEQSFTVSNQNKTSTYTVTIEEKIDDKYKPVVIGYLPLDDYEYSSGFDGVKWQYLTHINASFARASSDSDLDVSQVTSRIIETRDVAHANKVKILISVAKKSPGEFTKAIESENKRKKLAKQIVDFTRENRLDGFDIDYEDYDNWDANFPNLLAFAKELNRVKDRNMLMTCAVVSRWLNYGKEWHVYFDYINLMSYDYDVFNSEIPAQHAPYSRFVDDLTYWQNVSNAPKQKIVGGLPFYGYSWDDIPGRDKVRGIRFHNILSTFTTVEDIANRDSYSKTYYNGKSTIRQKCQYTIESEYGGVMIWQLFQDAHNEKDKLINVVGETMKGK